MWKKYAIVYQNGKVSQTYEVPLSQNETFGRSKPTKKPKITISPPQPKLPKLDRTLIVANKCRDEGITDPTIVTQMIKEIYNNSKNEQQIQYNVRRCMELINLKTNDKNHPS